MGYLRKGLNHKEVIMKKRVLCKCFIGFIALLFQWLGHPPSAYSWTDDVSATKVEHEQGIKPQNVLREELLEQRESSMLSDGATQEEQVIPGKNDLTTEEEKTLLKGIDSLCADSWCEGTFDFKFHTFKCSLKKQKCLFGFRYISMYRVGYGVVEGFFEFACVIKKVDSLKKLFGSEETFLISPFLYSTVDDCINTGLLGAWTHYEKIISVMEPELSE